MPESHLNEHLTPDRLEKAMRTLFELDKVAGNTYAHHHEKRVRQITPHSDSQIMEAAKKSIETFCLSAPPGNAIGLRMLSSIFANLVMFCGMEEEFMQLVEIAKQETKNHGN